MDRTITFPDASGTVTLTGGPLSNNLALTTDGSGQLAVAADAQNFNVDSDVTVIGNAGTDQVDITGNLDANNGLDVDGGNFSVAYANDPLPSLDIADAVGEYDFDGIKVFGFTIDDGPFNATGLIYSSMSISSAKVK